MEQKQFAEIFGLKVSTLNGYVTNYRTPDIDMQKKFADFFGVTVDYLIGRTDDRIVSEKRFYGANIILIMGNMTYEKLSEDIALKLNFPSDYNDLFSAEYLESIAFEKIIPTPQRISLLSKYAEVSPDFFYAINTNENLLEEREMYKKAHQNTFAYHLTSDMYNFVMDPQNEKYIKLAADIKSKGIDPEDIISFSLKYK
ncbi:MAG: helix-turn-helix transcriptional regulator [Ruminiclostridium sp.]|nr:helix-turn-helix transcriptional regulator [Ruminiclostridium sp.]